MDKFPLLLEGRPAGELETERQALYTWFTARCALPGEGLWCAWAVGERGELRLGVLEPAGRQAVIRRRFSDRMTAPLGSLLRGEVRPAASGRVPWEEAPEPEHLFRTPGLCRRLRGTEGVLTRWENGLRLLALPYDPKRPFPLAPMFCLARIETIRGNRYAVYAFDGREWPVLQG